MKVNYNIEMENIIKELSGFPKLLLHSCCGPCSTAVISRLTEFFNITVLYYNPNIEPKEEYEKRKQEQLKFIKKYQGKHTIDFLDCDYDNDTFHEKVKNHESDPEGGFRCHLCYELRLDRTAQLAKKYNYDFFCTTLTVSPYKNSQVINDIGRKISEKYNIRYLFSDFKKEEGYKKSVELAKQYDLYRQNYCGCLYSKWDEK